MKVKASLSSPFFVLIIYILALASGFLQSKLLESENNIYLSVIILQILIFIIPAIVFCRLKGVGYSMKLNIKLFSPGKLGCVIMSALVLICGSVLIRFAQIYVGGLDAFSFSMFSKSASISLSERDDVGSSMAMILALKDTAFTISTICCMAMESRMTFVCTSRSNPSSSTKR